MEPLPADFVVSLPIRSRSVLVNALADFLFATLDSRPMES